MSKKSAQTCQIEHHKHQIITLEDNIGRLKSSSDVLEVFSSARVKHFDDQNTM